MDALITLLHALPPEAMSLAMVATAYGGVLLLFRLFGLPGIAAFVVLALLGGNIQVIKVAKFSVFQSPVALGTELFASTYLAMDVIAENYGPGQARRTIWLGFTSQLLFAWIMILTLGYRPLTGPGAADQAGVEGALKALMQPQMGLLAAGLISYAISQNLDVTIFARLKRATRGGQLWFRNGVASLAAALTDNIIFSTLAWEVFTEKRVPLHDLIFTYILGTFYIRALVSLLDTPFMYMSRKVYRARAAFEDTPLEAAR